MPFCRDCADEDGTCPNREGLPCDPYEHDRLTIELKATIQAVSELPEKWRRDISGLGWMGKQAMARIKRCADELTKALVGDV
jgi:hypothetical protein